MIKGRNVNAKGSWYFLQKFEDRDRVYGFA